jgi:hypothetical protein
MTRKQPEEQDIRRYTYRASASVSRPLVRRRELSQRDIREQDQPQEVEKDEAQVLRVRRVTLPHEAVQPMTWAERQERFRQPRGEQPVRRRLVKRTLAQTGRQAPVGQIRVNKPLPTRRAGSSVPARSRQVQRGRSFWRRLLGFLGLLAVVGGVIGFALLSPTFHVQQVTISGTQNQALIDSIRHMGIQGQNIFLLNSSAVVSHLEAFPLVASASLNIQPPGTVIVTIEERVPVLLWQSGTSTFGIAQDGTVIAPLNQLSGTNHLALVVDERHAPAMHPGARLNAANVAFAEQVFEQAPGIPGVAPFALQYVDRVPAGGGTEPANQAGSGSYVIASASGWKAYLGDATNSNPLANRLLELRQILGMARQQNLQLATIDLRFGFRPTYTLKS